MRKGTEFFEVIITKNCGTLAFNAKSNFVKESTADLIRRSFI